MSTDVTFGEGPFIEGENYLGSDGKIYQYDGACFLCVAPEEVDEVWCGDEAPTDPNVEFWVSNGITKTQNEAGQWVQTTPYGA